MHVSFSERASLSDESCGRDATPFEEYRRRNRFKQVKFALFVGFFQLGLMCLFLRFAAYSFLADASIPENGISHELGGGAGRIEAGQMLKNFTLQAVLFIVLFGSHFSGSKSAQYRSASNLLSLLCICLGFQWALLCRGFLFIIIYKGLEVIRIDVHDLTEAFLATFSLSVTVAAILGRTSQMNLFYLVLLFPPLYTLNKFLNEELLVVTDPGSALSVHLFGSIFSYCVHVLSMTDPYSGYARCCPSMEENAKVKYYCKDHNSGGLGRLGAIAIFVCLPVLNSIVTESDAETTRAIVNTILASSAAVVISITMIIGISHVKNHPLNYHVEQGCLISGGVAIGSVATLMLEPHGAIVIGLLAGIISFYGISSAIGGLAAIVMAAIAEVNDGLINYHNSLYPIYPGRFPHSDDCLSPECQESLGLLTTSFQYLEHSVRSRSSYEQAGFQALAVLTTCGLSCLGGLLTGYLMRVSSRWCGNSLPKKAWFEESFLLNRRPSRGNNKDEEYEEDEEDGEQEEEHKEQANA